MTFARRVLAEKGMMEGTTSSYTAMVLEGHQPQPSAPPDTFKDTDDMGPSSGPKVLSSIELAHHNYCLILTKSHLLSERGYPRTIGSNSRASLAYSSGIYTTNNPDADVSSPEVPLDDCPRFIGQVSVFHTAVARFYAPSVLCGAGGMYREYIR